MNTRNWREDGYALFEISCLAGSSSGGWFAVAAESNCLAVTREMFQELNGFDVGFRSPGGGLCNLDFLRRACDLHDTELICLLGEGTFHQFHGGVATNVPAERHPWPSFAKEYEELRGEPFRPSGRSPLYLGRIPPSAATVPLPDVRPESGWSRGGGRSWSRRDETVTNEAGLSGEATTVPAPRERARNAAENDEVPPLGPDERLLRRSFRLVLVVGCQRSGTTLLGQLLGAQPGALLVDEDEGAYELLSSILERETLVAEVVLPILARANQKYKEPGRTDASGVPFPGVSHLVLKLPNATTEVEPLRRLRYPRSVVFAARDARDVVCSMARLPHVPMLENQKRRLSGSPLVQSRFGPDLERLGDPRVPEVVRRAIVWRIKTSLYADFVAPPLNAHLLHYRDLVCDPKRTLARVLRHVGLPEDEQAGHPRAMKGIGPGLTLRERPVDQASLDRWRRALGPEEEALVWAEAEPLMRELGYPRDVPDGTAGAESTGPDDRELHRPVIATGRGGSGTRLLSSLLQQLGVFLGNELNATEDSVEWVDVIYEMALKLLPERGGAPTRGHWGPELVARARSVLGAGGGRRSRPWGFKLPECMLVLPELASALPEARFIHLVRNPLDCCLRRTHLTSRTDNPIGIATLEAAYRALGRGGTPSEEPDHIRNAASWRFQVEQAREWAEKLGPRCLEVRYEDVCSRPQEVADRIAAFVGISRAEVHLDVDTARIRRWAADDPRIRDVWDLCGEVAEKYGYSLLS